MYTGKKFLHALKVIRVLCDEILLFWDIYVMPRSLLPVCQTVWHHISELPMLHFLLIPGCLKNVHS
jgi:hypothetical protein